MATKPGAPPIEASMWRLAGSALAARGAEAPDHYPPSHTAWWFPHSCISVLQASSALNIDLNHSTADSPPFKSNRQRQNDRTAERARQRRRLYGPLPMSSLHVADVAPGTPTSNIAPIRFRDPDTLLRSSRPRRRLYRWQPSRPCMALTWHPAPQLEHRPIKFHDPTPSREATTV
jgi:hypothetical protein